MEKFCHQYENKRNMKNGRKRSEAFDAGGLPGSLGAFYKRFKGAHLASCLSTFLLSARSPTVPRTKARAVSLEAGERVGKTDLTWASLTCGGMFGFLTYY